MNIILETPRLLLRPLRPEDTDDLFEVDRNPAVHRYLWQTPALQREESAKVIDYVMQQYEKHNIGRFATILKDSGEFIGWTGIKFVDDHVENGNTNFYDYGYRLNERFWNQGYASEATRFWLDYAFANMDIENINAYTHGENATSNRVLEKSGMTFMERYPDKDGVTWVWWQLKNPNHQP